MISKVSLCSSVSSVVDWFLDLIAHVEIVAGNEPCISSCSLVSFVVNTFN